MGFRPGSMTLSQGLVERVYSLSDEPDKLAAVTDGQSDGQHEGGGLIIPEWVDHAIAMCDRAHQDFRYPKFYYAFTASGESCYYQYGDSEKEALKRFDKASASYKGS